MIIESTSQSVNVTGRQGEWSITHLLWSEVRYRLVCSCLWSLKEAHFYSSLKKPTFVNLIV